MMNDLASPSQIRVSQLEVDGCRERGLSGAAQGLHPPGFARLRRDVDAPGGELRQAQADQQRAGRPRTCR